MCINDRLDSLFLDWENKYNDEQGTFVKDGIINERFWSNAKTKILFFAKEINLATAFLDNKPREYIEDFRLICNRYPWKVPGQWAYGLLNVTRNPPFEDARRRYEDSCRATAFMNAKKIAGVDTANMAEIRRYANNDADYLREELRIIDPDVVVCCGKREMFSLAKTIFPGLKSAKAYSEHVNRDIFGQCFSVKERIWIDFIHPTMRRGTEEDKYNSLLQAYNNII